LTVNWRKSTYSGASGGDCVEAATTPGLVLVRDTKNNRNGPILRVSATEWKRLTAAIKG
jgi:Domain of unknown function (DUF397)